MKMRDLMLVAGVMATAAMGAETEIIPCLQPRLADEQPYCCLKQTDTEYVLLRADKVLKRFTYSFGANMVDAQPVHERSLKTALDTLMALRQSGSCR